MSDFRDDPLWKADYVEALQELNGRPMLPSPPERKLLTVLELERPHRQDSGDAEEATFAETPRYRPIPMECHDVDSTRRVLGAIDLKDFDPVALRRAILSRIHTKRTATPGVRQVVFLGRAIGEVAKSPYQAFIWIASTNRRQPFSSLADAAVEVARTFIEGGAA